MRVTPSDEEGDNWLPSANQRRTRMRKRLLREWGVTLVILIGAAVVITALSI